MESIWVAGVEYGWSVSSPIDGGHTVFIWHDGSIIDTVKIDSGISRITPDMVSDYIRDKHYDVPNPPQPIDIQEVCDLCCDSPDMDVNNELVGKVFQWLIDNDYTINQKSK